MAHPQRDLEDPQQYAHMIDLSFCKLVKDRVRKALGGKYAEES